MNFKSNSFWENDPLFQIHDVIIVGAGIVGLSTAIYLKKNKPNLKVLVVESLQNGALASSRNAGFVCIGSPTEILSDLTKYGEHTVLKNLSLRWHGIRSLLNIISTKKAQLKWTNGYEVIDQPAVMPALNENIAYLNNLVFKVTGIQNYYLETPNMIQKWGFSGFHTAYTVAKEGQIQPALLLGSLLLKAQNLGVLVGYGIKVNALDTNEQNCQRLHTNKGTLKCIRVAFCTNAATFQLFPEIGIVPGRGSVLITKPLKKVTFSGNFHADEGYIYFRNVSNRLLIGGGRNTAFEEEKTLENTFNINIYKYLNKYIEDRLLPGQSFEIEQSWSGFMAFTANKQPIQKWIQPNCYIAAGLNGMGVAMGAKIGKNTAEALLKA